MIPFALTDDFGFLYFRIRSNTRVMSDKTHFAHGVSILCVDVLDSCVDLTLQFQFSAFLEIKTRCVDDRE